MELEFTPEEKAFREEARAFITSNLPDDIRDRVKEGRGLTRDQIIKWGQIMNSKGWAAPRRGAPV